MTGDMNKDWFIRALAEGEPIFEAEVAQALAQQLGLFGHGEALFCVAVSYCDISKLIDDAMMPVQLLHACNLVGKGIPGFLHAYFGAKLRIVMVFCEKIARNAAVDRLYSGLARRLDKPVKLGIGKAYTDIRKLSYSRVDAFEALDVMPSGTNISFIDDIYVSRSITTRKLEGEKRRVIDLFRSGRFEEMMDCLRDLSEQIREESPVREGMPYPTSIRRTVVELLVEILHIGSDAGVDVDAMLNHQDPYTRVFELHGTPKIIDWFLDVARLIHHGMAEVNSRSENNMLTFAKKCIDEHIQDPHLSLQLISEKLGITPGYFSAFFIREMDMGFNEYITGIRIELAKRLLMDPSKKINAIAAECGFQSASYFIFVFRKKTGLSPGAYRKQNM